jgi:protein-tyrosine-phosphatase
LIFYITGVILVHRTSFSKGENIMKALIEKRIESKVHIGSVLGWATRNGFMTADVVSYVKRNEQGEITNIAFASNKKIFNNRHKVNIFETDDVSPYKDNGQAIERWYQNMNDATQFRYQEML